MEFRDYIVCPYCGAEDHETADCLTLQHDGDNTALDCDECGREFRVMLCVSFSWGTSPMPATPTGSPTEAGGADAE